jgi:anti-sigma factor RsiW
VDCARTQNLIHAYLDRELDLVRHLEIEHHLQNCAACGQTYECLQALKEGLGADEMYFKAPDALRERLRSAMLPTETPRRVPRRLPWRAASFVGAAAALLVVGWSFGRYVPLGHAGKPDDGLAREVVAGHVRSLMAAHLTDVTSSNKHTVKPWFNGKVGFPVPVNEPSLQDLFLVGGRLDYIDHRSVAALVYRLREHKINVFLWREADEGEAALSATECEGYNLVHWTHQGMEFWAVSDLNMNDLKDFAARLREP